MNISQEKRSEKEDKQQLEEDLLEEMGRNIETCLEFRLCGNLPCSKCSEN
jgi:hypothetical protein